MSKRGRVVVTGMGLVSSLGVGTRHVWASLIKGDSGVRKIDRFDVDDLETKIGGQILIKGESEEYTFDPSLWVDEKEVKKMDNFILFGIAASDEALVDSGVLESGVSTDRIGVVLGSGIGGLPFIEKNIVALRDKGPRRVSPFFVPGSLSNLLAGRVSMKYGLSGYSNCVVGACATGALAVAEGARVIASGEVDVVVAGGAEGPLCRAGIAGFNVIKALSTGFNDTPQLASRPWDKGRDGFVMAEGAGVLVLEDYEHAKARGANIYAELVGYGITSDAYHVTAPHPEGVGGANAMRKALKMADVSPDSIDYINAHGTSTPMGDSIELMAVKDVFSEHAYKLAISSTKSSTGHLMGAAGSAEAIFSVLTITDGVIPPTLNLLDSSEDERLNLVPLVSQQRKVSMALSNSFGFGGINASLIFSAV